MTKSAHFRRKRRFSSFCIALLLLGMATGIGCRGSADDPHTSLEPSASIPRTDTELPTVEEELPVRNAQYSLLLLKGKGKATMATGASRRFAYRVHMEQGQRIWLSVSALGIEGIRLLATPDSLILINRLEATYFRGSYDWLEKQLGVPLNFRMLEDALLGNVHAYQPPVQAADPYAFAIPVGAYSVLIATDPNSGRVTQLNTQTSSGATASKVYYRKHRGPEEAFFPFQVEVLLAKGSLRTVVLTHTQVNTAPGELPFSVAIPRNYSPLTRNE